MIQQMEIFVERELALTVANQFPIVVIRASNWLGKNRRDASLQSDGTILHPLVNEVSVDKYLGNSEPYFYLFILFNREICCQIQKKVFPRQAISENVGELHPEKVFISYAHSAETNGIVLLKYFYNVS